MYLMKRKKWVTVPRILCSMCCLLMKKQNHIPGPIQLVKALIILRLLVMEGILKVRMAKTGKVMASLFINIYGKNTGVLVKAKRMIMPISIPTTKYAA